MLVDVGRLSPPRSNTNLNSASDLGNQMILHKSDTSKKYVLSSGRNSR